MSTVQDLLGPPPAEVTQATRAQASAQNRAMVQAMPASPPVKASGSWQPYLNFGIGGAIVGALLGGPVGAIIGAAVVPAGFVALLAFALRKGGGWN